MAEMHLDCKGLCCPLPIVEIARQFKKMEIGDVLKVEADDPVFQSDIEAWVEFMGHKLLQFKKQGNIAIVIIEKMC